MRGTLEKLTIDLSNRTQFPNNAEIIISISILFSIYSDKNWSHAC